MIFFHKKNSEEAAEPTEMENIEDTELDSVNGGYVFDHLDYATGDTEYQVIDDKTGEVLARYTRLREAQKDCRERGISDEGAVWATIDRIRTEYKEANYDPEAEARRDNIQRSRSIFLP